MSEANRVSLKSLREVTYGTTPVNSTAWQSMRFKSQNIASSPKTVISDEIRSDRMVQDLVVVGTDIKGDVGVELSAGTYDEWIESCMGGTWTTNVLKAGTTARSTSLEVGFQDWTTVQYIQAKGMRIGSMEWNIAYGEIVTGTFSFMGNAGLTSTTSLIGTGSVVTATVTGPMNAAAGVTAITLDGGAPGAAVKSVKFKVDNNLRAIEGVGSANPTNIAQGRSILTGTIEMYFETAAMYTKLLAGTSAALSITVAEATKSYTFLIPKLKFNSGVPAANAIDTDVMIPLEFTAIYDSTEATNLKITRVP